MRPGDERAKSEGLLLLLTELGCLYYFLLLSKCEEGKYNSFN